MIKVERRPDQFGAIQVAFDNVEDISELFPKAVAEFDQAGEELLYIQVPTPYSGPVYAPPGFYLVWALPGQSGLGYGPPQGPEGEIHPFILPENAFKLQFRPIGE